MNRHLQKILNFIQEDKNLTEEEKAALTKSVKDTDGDLTISESKLERTEKVKRTTSILLEETIEELEHKRKVVEAQNHELEIETALERVRAIALSMKEPADMLEVCKIISQQLELLNVKDIRNVQTAIFYESRGTYMNYEYYSRHDKTFIKETVYTDHKLAKAFAAKMLKGKGEVSVIHIKGEKLKDWLVYQKSTNVFIDKYLEKATSLNYYWHSLGPVALGISTYAPLTEAEINLFKHFRNVFELAYRRFIDIEKAIAQAKEAYLELALERVRARTMAMQKSDELSDAAYILFQQFKELGEKPDQATIGIINEEEQVIEYWVTMHGNPINKVFKFSFDEQNVTGKIYSAWKENKKSLVIDLSGNKLLEFMRYRAGKGGAGVKPDEKRRIINVAFFSKGLLNVQSNEERSEESIKLLERFASVFEQTYTRFLDLQKAEAQARESQIEAALERVRGKAMAMRNSEDLAETINVFYHEMGLLSVTPRRCGVGLISKETHIAELSTMNTTEEGNSIEIIGKLKLAGHPVLEGIYDYWLLQKEYHPVMRGNEIKEYYKLIRPQISYPDYPNDVAQFGYFFYFPEGGVYAWTDKALGKDELKIYRRFTTVLSLTYKRYKDLKDAEARTQIAIRQASLDRVRAEIASMRTAEDLQRITPLVWKELTALGVPFFRCGVFIMNEKDKKVHLYLSTPDAKPLAGLYLDFESSVITQKAVEYWRLKKVYTTHWDKEQFLTWVKSLIGQGQIQTAVTYQAGDEPPESLTLHFVPFVQGMLYVGSAEVLSELQIQLVKALAEAFSVAYARYEDFNNLEAAKEQVEKTLSELKSAQKQLIQSEKMASLGELTAGIAHEIQNPLNFVNNFSEVSNELINEMNEELDKGDIEEAKAIAADVKQNLEKINHHGKRAESIVKGMLQHSRTSTGQKEPTDINALADEYLRLSYHGLRAKDKSFNATMKTDFDNSIGKINIIPQDIGRVLLNLFNNAFYAVNEQISQKPDSYKPIVSVSTKKSENRVTITVSDNGNGIPQKIVDKIFQPFFTTKPTGQGTGLGLSLSYDIIKAHGGEIKVDSKEGEGTEFIILLPAV